MRRPLRRPSSWLRGSATVEFALVVPLLVTMLLFSLYLTELVRAKLKLLEVARYTAFEMTSYMLTDFAHARHDAAFEDAKREALREANDRFRDMDSADSNAKPGSFIVRYANLQMDVQNREVPFIEASLIGNFQGNGEGGSSGQGVVGAFNAGPAALLRTWGFNTKGWVRSDISLNVEETILPRHYLDSGRGALFDVDTYGGRNLASLPFKSRFSMYANGWNMPDGADATLRGRRAGAHRAGSGNMPHGLYQQVDRMTFLGLSETFEKIGIGAVLDFLASGLPNPMGTFVVSHNYGPNPSGQWARDCNSTPSYPSGAVGGLNNLDKFSQLDHDRPKCFDTAPFRDTAAYNDSLYLRMFQARGNYFMGCKNAQAEDATSRTSTQATRGDENDSVVNCE